MEERLVQIGRERFELRQSATGQWLMLSALSFGTFPKEALEKGGEDAERELARLLRENRLIVGDTDSFEFRITRISAPSPEIQRQLYRPQTSVRFHQVINGMQAPDSRLSVENASGQVISLKLVTGDPDNQVFDRSTWLSEEALHEQARVVIDSQLGGFDKQWMGEGSYRIVASGDGSLLIPAWEVQYAYYLIQIEAETGALHMLSNLAPIPYQ